MAFKFLTIEALNENINAILIEALTKKYGSYDAAPEARRKQIERMHEMMAQIHEHRPLSDNSLSQAFTHLNRLITKEIESTYWFRSPDNSVLHAALDRAVGITVDNKFDADAEKIAQESFKSFKSIMDKLLMLMSSDTVKQKSETPSGISTVAIAKQPETTLQPLSKGQPSSWWGMFNKNTASESLNVKDFNAEEAEDDFLRKITL